MKITTVSYQKTYSIGPYLTDKIGLEASLEDGESVADVLDNLRGKADEWHKAEHPPLYQESKPMERTDGGMPFLTHGQHPYENPNVTRSSHTPQVIDYKQKESLEISIDNASTLEDLAKLKQEAGANGLVSQYMARLNQLMTNGKV